MQLDAAVQSVAVKVDELEQRLRPEAPAKSSAPWLHWGESIPGLAYHRRVSLQRRSTFYDRAAKMTSYVAASAGDATFLVMTRDQNVGKSLFLKQSRGEMGVLARAVALVGGMLGNEAIEGRDFLDVGANIGTTTVTALMEHPFARAMAFEPEPQNLLTLKLNLLLNGVDDRATAHEVALSNENGTAELVVYPDQGGKHWLAADGEELSAQGDGASVVEVRTVTLDQLAADGVIDPERAGLLWMDAQAHEGHILGGASALVERGVPVVIEWDPPELDKRGDMPLLQGVAQEHYTHFIDLRASHDPDAPPFETRPVTRLAEYSEPFLEPEGRNFTDLLVLRLEDDAADGLDIRRLLAREGALKQRSPEGRAGAALLKEAAAELDEVYGGGAGKKGGAKARRKPRGGPEGEGGRSKQRATGPKRGAAGSKRAGGAKGGGPKKAKQRNRGPRADGG